MDLETINGSVETDETVTAQTLNNNQWHYHGKVLLQAKNQSNPEDLWPNLNHMS